MVHIWINSLEFNQKTDILFTRVNGETKNHMARLLFTLEMEITSKDIIMKDNNTDSADISQKIQFMKEISTKKECMELVN